jgi:hypothetical protein
MGAFYYKEQNNEQNNHVTYNQGLIRRGHLCLLLCILAITITFHCVMLSKTVT